MKGSENLQDSIRADSSENAKALWPWAQGKQAQISIVNGPLTACVSSCVCQAEVCAGTVAEVIQSVVNGADGCVFCFGHAKLGQWELRIFMLLAGFPITSSFFLYCP